MKVTKIYFGCSLTGAPEDYAKRVLQLRKDIAALPGVEHLPFLTDLKPKSEVTNQEIFTWDVFKQLEEADVVISECSQVSFGVAWELSYAAHVRKIPVHTFVHEDMKEKVSAFVTGAQNDQLPNYHCHYYTDTQEIIDFVTKKVLE